MRSRRRVAILRAEVWADKIAPVRAVFEVMRTGDRAAYLRCITSELSIEPRNDTPEQQVLTSASTTAERIRDRE